MAQRIDRAASFGQNLYVDTRGAAGEPVPFTQAVINGLAQGGGLYVPEELPTLSLDEICALARLPYAQRAAAIYKAFNVDLPDEAIDELMGRAYGDNFDDEAICPITSLDESTHILELWHGPTSAFKDMALQCLPHFFSASAEKLREEGTLDHEFMILVATSGDTGKAALEGFKGVDGVSIGVLFPDGGVSDIQRKQMVTTTGDNVQVWAVRGNFDDCQTGVKHAFADEKFAEKLLAGHAVLQRQLHQLGAAAASGGLLHLQLCRTRGGGQDRSRMPHRRVRSHGQLRQHPGRLVRQANRGAHRTAAVRQ